MAGPSSAASADWRVVGASVRGVSHQRSEQPCQDAHAIRVQPDGVLLIAVADGAGSAPLAEVGSALAVEVVLSEAARLVPAVALFEATDWPAVLKLAFQAARAAVEVEANARNCSLGDLATTLLLAIATPNLVVAGQIGDGSVVIRQAGETCTAVTTPTHGEYLNETTFLTSGSALEYGQWVVRAGPITGLAVLTDGLQMLALKMPQATAHTPFFQPLLRFVDGCDDLPKAEDQLLRFLQSPRVAERADDDLTIVLASRLGSV